MRGKWLTLCTKGHMKELGEQEQAWHAAMGNITPPFEIFYNTSIPLELTRSQCQVQSPGTLNINHVLLS